MSPGRPFAQDLITRLDLLSEDLAAHAKTRDNAQLPQPGGDPTLLQASADAAQLLSRLLTAILAFDNDRDDDAEALIQSTGVLLNGIRANTGV